MDGGTRRRSAREQGCMRPQLVELNSEYTGEGLRPTGGYPAHGGVLLNDTWQVALLLARTAGIRKG